MKSLVDELVDRLVIVVHEEVAGFWEIIAEGRNVFPGTPDSDLRIGAREAARQALLKGWIRVVIGSLVRDQWSAVDDAEIDGLLSDPLNWYPPATHGAWHVRKEATSAGDEEFRRRMATRQT
jgi:hypothetical protein